MNDGCICKGAQWCHMTAAEKLVNFRTLQAGWHFRQEGVPFAPEMLDKAAALNAAFVACGFQTDAFPGTDGGIQITLYHDGSFAEFNLEADGTADIFWEFDTP